MNKSGRSRPERGRVACIRTAGHFKPARGSTSSWITGREAPFCSRGAIVERDDKTISEDPRRQGCTRCARALRIASAARDLAAHRACSHILPTGGSRAIFARMARKGSRHSAAIRRVQCSRRVLSHQGAIGTHRTCRDRPSYGRERSVLCGVFCVLGPSLSRMCCLFIQTPGSRGPYALRLTPTPGRLQ